ncbi:YcxB family protein [Escherichia coli]|uniref:YcxB family protein n=2 Tax=Escherichia coli TaxID=562 RepID=UPI00185425DA|nr:YcxB family protein [Escherichia coli]EFP8425946.1 YcxB family protein [Shigella dysenteriae]EEZ8069547.1 YcxB family protein [Escherichia coli]EFF9717279.1 YcxB family protein [Escherichia coli]EFH7402018.1 YcxB family protein [Escherichia coli]EFK1981281.1 YcxB family protein [Escherichia coli]
MASDNRYSINFTLSVLEKTEVSKLIKEHEKQEHIEPYGYILLIKKAVLLVLSFAALFDFIILFGLIALAPKAPDYVERAKFLSIITFTLIAISIGLLYIYDYLMKKVMKSNYSSEIRDQELMLRLKINRSYIEQIMKIGSSRVFWNNIKKTYRKQGFLFIQTKENRCIIIPERVFKNEEETEKSYGFVKEQIAQNTME